MTRLLLAGAKAAPSGGTESGRGEEERGGGEAAAGEDGTRRGGQAKRGGKAARGGGEGKEKGGRETVARITGTRTVWPAWGPRRSRSEGAAQSRR